MLPRLLAKFLVMLCIPLSVPILILWIIFATATIMAGEFVSTLGEMHRAIWVEPNFPLAFYIARHLVGVFGGLLGWVSLVAWGVLWKRPWSRIPVFVKFGCLVGALSAARIPAATGLALPPILLCAALSWLAYQRDTPGSCAGAPESRRSTPQADTHGDPNAEDQR